MSAIRRGLEQYLALRRSLGLGLTRCDVDRALNNFLRFLEARHASRITTGLALEWATQPVGIQLGTCADRLTMVRRFAKWFSALEPRTEVPPHGVLPHRRRRRRPYIYSDHEIEQLIEVAGRLPSPTGLRGWTYSTLFGALAVTGMRLGEALGLDRDDVDWAAGVLSIRKAKFGKSRLVPVHPSTLAALRAYAKTRDRLRPHAEEAAFFLSESGKRIHRRMAEWTFVQVAKQVGLRSPGRANRSDPRLHDMRHRFAVQTFIGWYRAGLEVDREIPKLTTYLGHTEVNGTYWYVEAVPELLQLATQRLERRSRGAKP